MDIKADLTQFNCTRCGEPAYNHGPAHAPHVCDEYQAPRSEVLGRPAPPLTALLPFDRTGQDPDRMNDTDTMSESKLTEHNVDERAREALRRLEEVARGKLDPSDEATVARMSLLLAEAYAEGFALALDAVIAGGERLKGRMS